MKRCWVVLVAALAWASGCASVVITHDQAAEVGSEIATRSTGLLEAGEAIRAAREQDEEHEFITYPVYRFHDDEVHKKLRRIGYVTYHDAEHRIPRWVSQRLTTEWVDAPSSFSRRPSWRTDPELSGIGAINSDYTHSGYDRGHQVMQATLRGRGEQCEREGMYFANAAPQRHGFNAGIWLQLENQVIDWAREHNDVWMICGPVLCENPPTLKDAGRVSIPAKFFKIVGRNIDDGVAVIAFLFEHEPEEAHGAMEDYIVSIRCIETRTDLDFFSDLPQEIQDALEMIRYSMEFDGTPLSVDDD